MEELDGDEVRVSSRGRFAERDIVQVQYIATLISDTIASVYVVQRLKFARLLVRDD